MLQGSGLLLSEDVTRRAKDSRAELRKFSREIKMADPNAVVKMDYDKLDVNGKKYTWSDAVHAVMDVKDNSVLNTVSVSSDF